MARILLVVVVVFAVWALFRAAAGRRRDGAVPDERATPPATNAVEPVAQCAWCGVHVPSGNAVSLPDGRVYCGPSHRDRALASTTPSDRG